MELHVHIYDLDKMDEDGNVADDFLVDELDVPVSDVYDDLRDESGRLDGTGYVQFVFDSAQLPGKSVEIRIPTDWLTLKAFREAKRL